VAQETGRRVAPILSDLGLRKTPANFIRYRARPGDTLGKLAKRFNTTVPALKSANGLRTSKIRENRDYRIPVPARQGQPMSPPLRFPPRRLPPEGVVPPARMSSRGTP
jgi:LysM repeat protein